MKLSEAIRLGSLLKPQWFAGDTVSGNQHTCALQAALDAVGKPWAVLLDNIEREWPWVIEILARCPACCRREYPAKANKVVTIPIVYNQIIHLNDYHRWTRLMIADWVEGIEPQETLGETSRERHANETGCMTHVG